MTRQLATLVRLARSRPEAGATAVEYALMASLIAVVIVVAVTLFGQNLSTLFSGAQSI